jgi:hypothetical protein
VFFRARHVLSGTLALQSLTPFTLSLQLFAKGAGVMCQIGKLLEQTVQEFKLLGVKAKAAATEARDKEALLGEIPEEFLDPIHVHTNIHQFRVGDMRLYAYYLKVCLCGINYIWMTQGKTMLGIF